ncbi:MAG: 4-hydroxy-tetrahydrodipicolinate reductase [Magnetococcales bacterium]|nr:4-hydroxy-tetrahydrodipicolinate reductase [Magnetococcales bacterium]
MSELQVGVIGAYGRMGRMVIQCVIEQEGCRLVAASDHFGCPGIGKDAGEVAGLGTLGVSISDHTESVFQDSDVVIDFTLPEPSLRHVKMAIESGKPLVIGTTGIDDAGKAIIKKAAKKVPIVHAPNFSVGVNLMFKVAAEMAKTLGEEVDIEVIEAHHRHKVDAPSGTALRLGESIAQATGRSLDAHGVFSRHGDTGERNRADIGFATVRGGDIVGDHTAMFAGDGERLEITHRASSRILFAKGALRAALWVVEKKPGLYDMQDILGFR